MEAKPNKELGKPESHSDVLNKEPSALLIGYGWVGQHVHKYFKGADYFTPDMGLRDSEGRNLNLPWEAPKNYKKVMNDFGCVWDVAFISVPTPMKPDGSCDVSIVEQSIKNWERWVKLFIIRSTVTPGTTFALSEKYGARVVFQPEYIGETLGHPMLEPARDPFIILGGKPEDTALAAEFWSRVLHANSRIRQVNSVTAEVCKYMENAFLGTKVIFVNEFARLARKLGLDYLTLREAWLDDPRVGRSHSFAYEGNPGFSGKCLPKDLNSIVNFARKAGQPLKLIEAVLKINAEMRQGVPTTQALLPEEKEVEKWK